MLRRRYKLSEAVLNELVEVLCADRISSTEQAMELAEGLGRLHGTDRFHGLKNMGEVLRAQLITCLGV